MDIFDERDKFAIEMALNDDKERIRQLEEEVRMLREVVKMSSVKIEGYEYMMQL